MAEDFQLEVDEFFVTKIGHVLMFAPKAHRWEPMEHSLSMLPLDTFPERGLQGELPQRERWTEA